MPKKTQHPKKKAVLAVVVVAVLLLGTVLWGARNLVPVFFNVIFNKEIQLKKVNGNINVMLLGIGGGVHDGPNLSDAVIFISINPEKNTVSMISIPRDLWIEELKGRINTAYASGKGKSSEGGLILAKAVVSKVTGQHIDYGLVINFSGFVKAVDLLGGVDINVENAFDDRQYPIESKYTDLCDNTLEQATERLASESAQEVFPCRYEDLHFNKGQQHMNGESALKYVRSRYALGVEGTDFARSRRQQLMITALKEKAFSVGLILNPLKIADLYSVLSDSIDTDIPQSEFDDFIKLIQKMKTSQVRSTLIAEDFPDENKRGLLLNPPVSNYDGAWVLIPRIGSGNYQEINDYVSCYITVQKECVLK